MSQPHQAPRVQRLVVDIALADPGRGEAVVTYLLREAAAAPLLIRYSWTADQHAYAGTLIRSLERLALWHRQNEAAASWRQTLGDQPRG